MRSRAIKALTNHRLTLQATIDVLAWFAGIAFAALARMDFTPQRVDGGDVLVAAGIASAAQIGTGWALGLYTGRWRFGSFDEVAAVARAALLTTVLFFAVNAWVVDTQLLPRAVPLGAGMAALVAMAGTRYVWRLSRERRSRPDSRNCQRLLVFGAGEGAAQIITAMLRDQGSRYVPVALLDDDPRKRRLRISGVPVVGSRDDLCTAAVAYRADAVLIAIPSADSQLVADITELALSVNLPTNVLPPVAELFGEGIGLRHIREVSLADLVGRHEIKTDLESVAGYLTGKRVLVTGAGGSIGSELCRQISKFAPASLIMVDRDESALHALQLSIDGVAMLDSPDLVLLDIRDRQGVHALLASRRPHVVFHAAALKHLPLLERYPGEAVRTNVWATLDLLDAAVRCGVERFVNISTDKAAEPCNALGYTKRLAERLTAYFAATADGTFVSVRFGNVVGSRGSVLTAFTSQIARGGPVTVTHEDVTRYLMTVEEAVQLVIQAGAIGSGGEVLVLDMGEPVRIRELAQLLVSKAGRPIEIQITGLRPGEKLHEVLFGDDEVDARPVHPLISHVLAPPIDPRAVEDLSPQEPPEVLLRTMAQLCRIPTPAHAVGSLRIDDAPPSRLPGLAPPSADDEVSGHSLARYGHTDRE